MKNLPSHPRFLGVLLILFVSIVAGHAAIPPMGVPAGQATSKNVPLVFSAANGNVITITNAGAGTNKLEITLAATQGTATLKGTSGLAFTLGDGTNDSVMTFRGTSTNINAALNGLVFNPSNNYLGAAALTLLTPAAELAALNADGGLEGRYSFDTTSAAGRDTSPGGTRSGTVTGATAAEDTERGNVLNLDAAGGTDYVQVAGRFGDPANVTLAAWVNLASADSWGSEVISLGDRVNLRLDAFGSLEGGYFNGLTGRTVSYSTTIEGSGWRHVAYTFDDAGNAQALYLDGVQVASTAETPSISYLLGVNTTIGRHPTSSLFDFSGKIDEARVYSRALSSPEIAILATDLSARVTNSVAIAVIAAPSIIASPASQSTNVGSSVTLAVGADGSTPLVYQWYFSGASIANATNATLTFSSVQLTNRGNYFVVVTNDHGSVTSAVATVTVLSTVQILAAQDTYLDADEKTFNHGASTNLLVDKGGGGLGDQRVLLQFSLGAIPAGSTITDASLLLQATASEGAMNLDIHRVTESWVEGTGNGLAGAASWNQRAPGTNWNSSGGTVDSTVIATLNTGSIGQHSWNLTTLVQGWFAGSVVNQGILIGSPDGGSKITTYNSREGATPPQLRVVYENPPETAPTISVQPTNQTVELGLDVTFTVVADGFPLPTYLWHLDDVPIAGATNATLMLTNVQPSQAGSYHVAVSNSAGSATSQVAVLTVQFFAPSITSQPVGRTVYEGTNVSFSVTATGTAPLSYQWTRDGVDISGKTNSSLTLTNVALGAGGDYTVIITNCAGSVTSQVAVLNVQAVPPSITSQPVGRTINDGGNASFSVTATGTAPLAYQWARNGSGLSGETNSSLNLSNVALTASGNYTIIITNSAGSVTSQVAVLNVLPVPPTITSQPVSQNTTAGSSVTLTVGATGSPTLLYQWQRNGVALEGETNATLNFPNVQVADAGNYRVVVINGQGSATSTGADLAVVVPPLGMTDNFSLVIASTNLSGVGQSSNTLATLEVDEPLHDGKPGGKSMWFAWQAPASGIATFSTAGSDFDTVLAVYQGDAVNALVPVASDDDTAGFYNSEVQFNVNSNGVYHIAVDGAGGVEGSIILQWNLEATSDVLPVITNQPVTRIVSLGGNAVYMVGVAGVGAVYQWFFNDAPIPAGTNSVWNQNGVGLVDIGQFRVEVTIGTRTVGSRRAGLQINLTPAFVQDFANSDKFIDMVSSGRRLRLDPPPSSSSRDGLVSPSGPSRGFSGSQVFSTVGSLKEPGEPDHCGIPGGASQWFAFQAESDGLLAVNTDGSTFDTVLAVYTGSGASFSSLTPVVCDNDSGTNGQTSSLHFTTTTGTIYYIAIDGVNGARGTVVLNYTTLGEQQRPSISVTSAPPANIGLTNDTALISGIATDNTELSYVEWRVTNSLGTSTWTTASGSNSWTFTATNLAFGRNAIQIRSWDSWGNPSVTTSLPYLRLAPLTLVIDGCGEVSGGSSGTTYFEPGKGVKLTGSPCGDSLFAGWTGAAESSAASISLIVQTGMVVQANFVTNQFAGRPGTYVGLFYDTNVLSHDRSGFVSVRTTTRGTFSGKLRLGMKSRSFKGRFGLDGRATNLVSRGRDELPLEVQMDFNFGEIVESLTGRVIDADWTGELTAHRAVFHSRTNPAPYQGLYTLILSASGAPGTPEGDGHASIKVSAGGAARLKGSLADGTILSQSAPISFEGVWPLYVPFRGGRGSVLSWLVFETNTVSFGTNVVQSELWGDMRWVAFALPGARYYPDGFTNALEAVGSRYTRPASSADGALTFTNGALIFSGGNLSAPFTNNVLRAPNDRFTNEGTNKLSLKIARSTGLLKGSVVVPESGAKLSFRGALFQNGDIALGYLLQTNASGPVLLAPRE